MRSLTITIFTLLAFGLKISGQIEEQNIEHLEKLSLNIRSINFVKNNEYFNPITEGYTLLGFFFRPELVYSPSAKITLRAGTHILSYSGAGKFSDVRPLFSTTLNISEKTNLTIGSLSGSDRHNLFDPHFDSERLYSSYAEDGFQVTTVNDHLFSDTWLSWENFIFKGDSTREVFTFGESFRYTSSSFADIFSFELPVQLQFKHFGGQISNYPEHVETLFNLAAGLKINIDIAKERFGKAGVEYLQFINRQFNGESQAGVSQGYASWFRLHYSYKALYVGAAYWKGHNFYAPNGNMIYSSISDYQENVVIPERKIITNYFYLTLLPESYLELFLGLETYYDIDIKRLDSAISLHLSFDKLINLATQKK